MLSTIESIERESGLLISHEIGLYDFVLIWKDFVFKALGIRGAGFVFIAGR